MSSTADTAVAQRYFCHQCDRTVTLMPSPSSELACPICQGGFIEEFELPEPPPPTSASASPDPFSLLFSPSSSVTSSAIDIRNPADLLNLLGFDAPSRRNQAGAASGAPEPFNPLNFLQSYVQSLAAGGANIQFVVEGGSGNPGAATFGDYFVGPGLEQLIQQLMDNDPNRYGTPPASKSAVETLPDVKITEELLASDEAQCAVCKDTFEAGAVAKQMPCKHIYHDDCIIPWLELHNSCPVCRYELPTDDPDYEIQRGAPPPPPRPLHVTTVGNTQAGAAVGGGSAEPSSPSPRMVERRFRISLPWPWRTYGSMSEGSNSGGAGGSGTGGNDGGNSDQSENPGVGPHTRHEGLD